LNAPSTVSEHLSFRKRRIIRVSEIRHHKSSSPSHSFHRFRRTRRREGLETQGRAALCSAHNQLTCELFRVGEPILSHPPAAPRWPRKLTNCTCCVLKVRSLKILLGTRSKRAPEGVLSLSYTWSSHKRGRQNTLRVLFSNAS